MPRDTPVEKTFETIRSVGDVWSFLQGPFLASLYNEVSYTGEPLPPEQHRLVLGQSRVIGRVRLQQVRVRGDGCSVPAAFSDPASPVHIPHCYPEWSLLTPSVIERNELVGYDPYAACEAGSGDEDEVARACNETEGYGAVRSYQWRSKEQTGQGAFVGWFSTYGQGAYFVDLPNAQADVRTRLAELEQDTYFDLGTRAIWVDFTLFNANVHRFLVVRLLFERLEAGGVHASSDFRSLHLLWYDGDPTKWLAQLVPEACLLLLVLAYILVELYEMKKAGKGYFSSLWNVWDWCNISLLIAAAVCRYQQFRGMRAVQLHLKSAIDSFPDFRSVAVYADTELSLTAVCAFMVYLKVSAALPPPPASHPLPTPPPPSPRQVLHFLGGVPRIDALLQTFGRASRQLVLFTLCLVLLLLGFACGYNLAFGTNVYAWRSVGHSAVSLLHFVQGVVDPFVLREVNWVLGPFL